MDAGRYTERITIQKREPGERNKNGFPQREWVDYYENFAYANKLSGSEYYSAATVQAQETVKLTFRWKKALEAVNPLDYRVLWNGVPFNIKDIDNVQYRNEKVIIKVMPQENEDV